MKLKIAALSIAVLLLGITTSIHTAPQPVVAEKTVDRTKEWTIGIYGPNKELVPGSEMIVFKRDTKFLSNKGNKLFFNFAVEPNVDVYVLKANAKKETITNLAIEYEKNPANMLKTQKQFTPVTATLAPAGSKIIITGTEISIGKPTTRKVAKEDVLVRIKVEKYCPRGCTIDEGSWHVAIYDKNKKLIDNEKLTKFHAMMSIPANTEFFVNVKNETTGESKETPIAKAAGSRTRGHRLALNPDYSADVYFTKLP